MTKLKAFKKSLLEIVAYRKKYSFPDKVITKKMGALEKLAKLLLPGRSKIYLSDIKKNYARAYLSTPGHEYTKSHMSINTRPICFFLPWPRSICRVA